VLFLVHDYVVCDILNESAVEAWCHAFLNNLLRWQIHLYRLGLQLLLVWRHVRLRNSIKLSRKCRLDDLWFLKGWNFILFVVRDIWI
jgi:hypothetical protein